MKTVLAVFLAIVLFGGAVMIGAYINITNTEITMRKRVEAQEDVCKANFDKMFKVIAQVAEVPDHFLEQSKEAFKEIYIPMMEGRYSNERGGALMSWVQESNPNFDLSAMAPLYKNLQITIEANREAYFIEQKKLIDIHREHSTYISLFFQRLFLGGVQPVDITIVTSSFTEKAYQTGKEDDIQLFNKQK